MQVDESILHFKNLIRMSSENRLVHINLVVPNLVKQDTNIRPTVAVKIRMAVFVIGVWRTTQNKNNRSRDDSIANSFPSSTIQVPTVSSSPYDIFCERWRIDSNSHEFVYTITQWVVRENTQAFVTPVRSYVPNFISIKL